MNKPIQNEGGDIIWSIPNGPKPIPLTLVAGATERATTLKQDAEASMVSSILCKVDSYSRKGLFEFTMNTTLPRSTRKALRKEGLSVSTYHYEPVCGDETVISWYPPNALQRFFRSTLTRILSGR